MTTKHHRHPRHNDTTACKNLVLIIEELLDRRRKEMGKGKVAFQIWNHNDWPREWEPSELRDSVYSSYFALRRGKLKRPPPPNTIMEIADYLECNREERNRLLIAARYAPTPEYLRGEDLAPVVNLAKEIAQYIPLPAYIINRDWSILFLNQHILKFMGLTEEEVIKIAPDRLNILRLILDPELPVYHGLTQNLDSWEYMARRNIYGFKLENSLSQYEDWFEPHVTQLMKLPRFREFWDEVQIDWCVDPKVEFPYYVTEMLSPIGRPVRFRSLITLLGDYDYPQIVSYIPVNQDSRAIFTELGIPTPENGWGTNSY